MATNHGVTIVADSGNLNKGWVGQLLDKLAMTQGVNAQEPDGHDYELKSTTLILRHGNLVPQGSMAITMFNPSEVMNATSFTSSHLWQKLERMIVVGVEHISKSPATIEARVRLVQPVDVADPDLASAIEAVWMDARDRVIRGEIADYGSAGTSSNYVQLRTKGGSGQTSTCPLTNRTFNSLAFYATKRFLEYVLGSV